MYITSSNQDERYEIQILSINNITYKIGDQSKSGDFISIGFIKISSGINHFHSGELVVLTIIRNDGINYPPFGPILLK
jgi:hypothetical protein